MTKPEIYLIRHGETEWSLSGQHTGNTDISLTPKGEKQAEALGDALRGIRFGKVFTSPLLRARRTCELAGLSEGAEIVDDLREWNYGEMEGKTTVQIQREIPKWSVWREGPRGGETLEQVSERAQRVLDRLAAVDEAAPLAIFAHGHILRILTARYLDLKPADARLFALSTATLSVLGYEHSHKALRLWNQAAAASSANVASPVKPIER